MKIASNRKFKKAMAKQPKGKCNDRTQSTKKMLKEGPSTTSASPAPNETPTIASGLQEITQLPQFATPNEIYNGLYTTL